MNLFSLKVVYIFYLTLPVSMGQWPVQWLNCANWQDWLCLEPGMFSTGPDRDALTDWAATSLNGLGGRIWEVWLRRYWVFSLFIYLLFHKNIYFGKVVNPATLPYFVSKVGYFFSCHRLVKNNFKKLNYRAFHGNPDKLQEIIPWVKTWKKYD